MLAGLSTSIGGLIALFAKRTNTDFLSFALGFSAGVMIYVAMVEIFAEARLAAVNVWGTAGPVSYTHLDVYKRQPIGWSHYKREQG